MPPRKGKRKFDEEDELDRAGESSRWAALLQQDEEEEVPQKEIFKFDFSKEHLLLREKEAPRREEARVELSAEERAELGRRLEKERAEKEAKEKVRREKQLERRRQLEKEKEEEQARREEEEKREQEFEKMLQSNRKQGSDTKRIFYFLLTLALLLATLQYHKDIYVKLSKFRLDGEVNYYEVLETSSGVGEAELKAQYKKLVLKYHPDKNPNCHSCKDKFDSIMQAWEVLGNAEKRLSYDQSSGYVNQISSQTVTLTPENYELLLGDSDEVWIVQAYDSTSQYCHFFAKFWEELHESYRGLVGFGRLDVWQQSEMKSFLPYNFQLFPGLYTLHRGQQRLCQLDFDRPHKSIDHCIEEAVRQAQPASISDWSQIAEGGRRAVIVGGGIKLGTRMKLLHAKFSRYYDFYVMGSSETTVQVRGWDLKFSYGSFQNSKKLYEKYAQFLQSGIVQERSLCEVHVSCREQPCILLVELEAFRGEALVRHPVLAIKERSEFLQKIELIKNMTGLNERFELALYQDGKLELGNFDELDDLHPEAGEVMELVCVANTWVRSVIKLWKRVLEQNPQTRHAEGESGG